MVRTFMKSKLIFGLGGVLLLVTAVLSALAWTPLTQQDRAVVQVGSDIPGGE